MAISKETAQEDLAFMRALVSEDSGYEKRFGLIYGAAGILYGLQCLINGWMLMAGINASSAVWIALGIIPTVLFILVMIAGLKNAQGEGAFGTGASKRAVNAMFAGGGIANIVLAAVFGWVAYVRGDWSLWFLFPAVVAALQGAAWCAAAITRRSAWSGMVAAAWFVATVMLGLLINDMHAYLTALGAVMFLCMGLPGYVIVRKSTAA